MKIDYKVELTHNSFKALRDAAPGEAGRAVSALAEYGRAYVVKSMNDSPADGRTYTRGSITHRASSPGNPPKPDTGTLLDSFLVVNVGPFERAITTQGLEYAEYLEYGTSRMAARPFMGPMALHLETVAETFFDEWLSRMGRR